MEKFGKQQQSVTVNKNNYKRNKPKHTYVQYLDSH